MTYLFDGGSRSRVVMMLVGNRMAGPCFWWMTRYDYGRPCGVIGMCMTGGFALALAVQPSVRAAVMAQPAMPISHLGKFPLPSADARAADLGLSPDTKMLLRRRLAEEPDALCVRGYRFRDDSMSPRARLEAARDLLGDEARTIVTLTEPDPAEHSTLTGDNRNRAAVLEVKAFLSERLAPPQVSS